MSIVLITLLQTSILMVLVILGIICTKFKMIDDNINKGLSGILIHIVTPCLIINNLQVECTPENVKGILITFGFVFAIYVILAFVVSVIYRKNDKYDYKVFRFMAMYANCGYMGVPLIQGILGSKGVFFVVAAIAVFNLFAFTHGVILMRNDEEKVSLKGLISPALISIVIGMIFLLTGFKLPVVIGKPIAMMSELNSPLAMLVSGYAIANTDFKHIKNIGHLVQTWVLKLLIFPILVACALKFIPVDPMIKLVTIITSGCSSATVGVIFSVKYDRDSQMAATIFATSTLLIIVTMPIVMYVTTLLGITL